MGSVGGQSPLGTPFGLLKAADAGPGLSLSRPRHIIVSLPFT